MIRNAEHLADLMVKIDLVLADGQARGIFELLDALIGRPNPMDQSPPDHIGFIYYRDFCGRNGFTPTDINMCLLHGKYPSGWRAIKNRAYDREDPDSQPDLWVQVWSRRDHAAF